jgi:NhaC family Na+:H+ antiporter
MITLITLIALTIVLFGTAATDGPLQVALFASATCAGLVAMKNGYSSATIRDVAIGGVSSAMGAIYILLAVGALIGTWNLGGTIPTIVNYGVELLRPNIFYVAVALICAAVGAITGSSWTTAATLGVAFMGMASIVGVSETTTAGAIVSGAYMGDKMSPLSETTILVPSLVGDVTTSEHIRGMVYTVLPAFLIAIGIYLLMGFNVDVGDTSAATKIATDALHAAFSITPLTLLPLALLILLSYKRVPAFLALFSTAIFSGILASFTQPDVVREFVGKPDQNAFLNGVEAIYKAVATGFVSNSGNETIDALFSRGGMASMLTTVWLILGALSFAAIMEHAGLLDRLIRPLINRSTSAAKLLFTVAGTAIGLNVVAGDQYVAIVLPSRIFRLELHKFHLAPRMLSRTVEDTGTVTSPLVPWNSCGAYMTGVLGTSTLQYAPWAFFNYLNPLVALAFIATGFRVERTTDIAPIDLTKPQTPEAAEDDHVDHKS